jgi:hypothetical protein
MSFTKRLKHKDFKNLRNWFKYHFPNPGLSHGDLNVIGTQGKTSNYGGDIGTAFDYLFRFKMEQMNEVEGNHSPENWVALKGFAKFDVSFQETIEPQLEHVVFHYLELVRENKISDGLFEACLFLNQLDIYYRTGIVDEDFGKADKKKIKELGRIYDSIDWNKFAIKTKYTLNPIFGVAELNIGADGDFIFNKTLIDIKCSKTIKLERFFLNQLIGYSLLNLLKDKDQQYDIDTIGVYFARADYLWIMKLDDYYSFDELKDRAEEFKELIVNPSLDLLPENREKRNISNTLDSVVISKNVERAFASLNKDNEK